MYGTSVTALHGSMDITKKYSIAHSHVWTNGHSNLANCKFTLVYSGKRRLISDSKQQRRPARCKLIRSLQ